MQAAINAAGGQLPKNLPTPPTYRKVNPADSPILLLAATSDTLPLTDGRRQCRDQARPADQPDSRRRAGHHRRPAEAGDPHPARSGEARGQGSVARGCAHAAHRSRPSTIPKAQFIAGRARFTIYTNDQLTRRQATGTTSSSPTAMARRCGCAISAGRSTGRRTRTQAAWADGKRGMFLVIYKQPGANVIDTVDKIMAAAAAASRRPCRRRSRSSSLSDRTQTIRAVRPGRAVHAAAHHRAGGDGDLHLPAQPMGDDHPERHGAAGVARRLRADVDRRLHASTICR